MGRYTMVCHVCGTKYCGRKVEINIYSALLVTSHLRVGSASAERVGQEEVGGG